MTSAGYSNFIESRRLLEKSSLSLAGGISSHVRRASKPFPLFFRSAAGSHVTDVDGNTFIDYSLAWGPLILGHSHPSVVGSIVDQVQRLDLVGAQHELEMQVAEKICQMVPCADLVAFSNSGSEAVQVALRVARAFTQRTKIIRFEGHYHGWLEEMLIGYRPNQLFETIQGNDLTPSFKGYDSRICVLPWNDLSRLEDALKKHSSEVAAIITEPILCNCNCLMPLPGYLEGMRDLATRYGVILIFDEVITGFRVARGGAQDVLRVTPDLAVFGKAVAGGFPLSVVAGKREFMELIATGSVLHAGTFNGNPMSLAAADATLSVLDADSGAAFQRIRQTGERLMRGIRDRASEAAIPILVNGVGGAFHVAFTKETATHNYRETLVCDLRARDKFIESMLSVGIYLLPDGRWYVSAVHGEADLEITLEAVQSVVESYRDELMADR
ncbi:MAG: aspartate aminotransferase family protein [Acidobacteriota bacterium]